MTINERLWPLSNIATAFRTIATYVSPRNLPSAVLAILRVIAVRSADEGERRLTRARLDVVDEQHRHEGWNWQDPWGDGTLPRRDEPTGLSLPDVITALYDLYVEAGAHATQGPCDEHFYVLRDTRRLLGRIIEDAED